MILSTFFLLAATSFSTILAAPAPLFFGDLEKRHAGHADQSEAAAEPRAPESSVVAGGWYAPWYKQDLPVSAISWEKYSELAFAFAVTTPDSSVLDLLGEEETLREFVKEAQDHQVKAFVSVGGWTGSQYFSSAVATAENRTIFVKTITGLATEYNLDGIDFDWEFPNGGDGVGLPCNINSESDTQNFLTFLEELKADPVGSELSLTAAAHIAPFTGAGISDLSGFAQVFDHLVIMGYDINGLWSTPAGANAPLKTCPGRTGGSVEKAVDDWVAAGFPADKLVLGVPFYARSYIIPKESVIQNDVLTTFNPAFDRATMPPVFGERETLETIAQTLECGQPAETPSGIFTFNGLIATGYLNVSGEAAPGVFYAFDDCTETSFLYRESDGRFISYDDTRSLAAKGQFINDRGLAGFAAWHVGGDTRSDILLDALHESMGIVADTDSEECIPSQPGETGSGNDEVVTVTVTVAAPTSSAAGTPTVTSPAVSLTAAATSYSGQY
ncbi:glycoside hydrolase [Coprinopsis marcescibilis]|uniref:Glycoside hydrolase n=1 Tax=Coprinopsis marcescibilis TaxID=230819 RepID=A0A5C3KJY7_COPMA|nr:glycoside hydrolase [Coprinopsis marcescibilis]